MNQLPINEPALLQSLPGFNELLDDEKLRIEVKKFDFINHPVLFTSELLFIYTNPNNRRLKLKFEAAGNREANHFYTHVLYMDTGEIEFSDFKSAIGYCNRIKAVDPTDL